MSTAVYGFVSWMTACVVFIIYLVWAFLPDRMLKDLGISYYPSKYWALGIPTYLMVSMWLTVFAYSASFFYLAPALDNPILIRDSFTKSQRQPDSRFAIQNAHDLDLAQVNRHMFARIVIEDNRS
jgi:phosphatidylinositol glycan class P protein